MMEIYEYPTTYNYIKQTYFRGKPWIILSFFLQLLTYMYTCINVEQKQYLMPLFLAYKEKHI